MCAHTGLQLPASLLTAKVNSRGWWVISNFRRCSHICSFPECLHSLKPSALSRLFFCTLAPTTKCPQKVFYCGKPCLSLPLPLRLLVTESLFFFFFFFLTLPQFLFLSVSLLGLAGSSANWLSVFCVCVYRRSIANIACRYCESPGDGTVWQHSADAVFRLPGIKVMHQMRLLRL